MPIQTVDADAFINEQNDIATKLLQIREKIQRNAITTVCLRCGEDIGEARLNAIPGTENCIDCANELEKPHQDPPYANHRKRSEDHFVPRIGTFVPDEHEISLTEDQITRAASLLSEIDNCKDIEKLKEEIRRFVIIARCICLVS